MQAGAVWRSDPSGECSETGAEARWLGGAAFGPEQRGFVNVEAAARSFDGGCQGGLYELSLGYRPNDEWMGMAQVFVDDSNGDDETVRAQLTLVRFGEDGRGLQVGVRARLDGDDAEPALVLGFWGVGGD